MVDTGQIKPEVSEILALDEIRTAHGLIEGRHTRGKIVVQVAHTQAKSGGLVMSTDRRLREQLLALLRGGHAHMDFDEAVAAFPLTQINAYPPHVPYTPWHLLEHLRITQWDILEFIRNPSHTSPTWPEGYWPAPETHTDMQGWVRTIAAFQADLRALQELVADPATDFTAPLAHAPDYTILREILVVADHNAYHIGEFAILRQVMETWAER
jgi:zinc-binding alcohol dehydrogenase family protein/DinB family protein